VKQQRYQGKSRFEGNWDSRFVEEVDGIQSMLADVQLDSDLDAEAVEVNDSSRDDSSDKVYSGKKGKLYEEGNTYDVVGENDMSREY
jgi:hypothetical protein